MDDLPPFVRLVTNFWWLSGLLLGLILVLHIVLIWVWPLGKVGWKRTDYIWLTIATLGLISLSGELRRWVSSNRLELATARVQYSLDSLRSYLVKSPPTHFCTEFIRSELSPPNLDDIQRQYHLACDWLRTAPAALPKNDDPPFQPLNFDDTHVPKGLDAPVLVDTIKWIRHLFEEYEQRRLSLIQTQQQTKQTDGEDAQRILSPILLCLALALRITKVTGEVRLESSPSPNSPKSRVI